MSRAEPVSTAGSWGQGSGNAVVVKHVTGFSVLPRGNLSRQSYSWGPHRVVPVACLGVASCFKNSHLKTKSKSSCWKLPFFHSKTQNLASLFKLLETQVAVRGKGGVTSGA